MFTIKIDNEIQLALVEPSFAAKYFAIVQRDLDYLSQWLAWPEHAKDEAFFHSFITRSLHDYAAGKSLTCAIILKDEVVGNIAFNSINHSLKKAEIGYWLSAQHQGRGIVSRAVSALFDMAFTQLGMEKVQISAAVSNQPSRAVCERLNMELEGIITNAENLNGRIVDHAIYGLSKTKWINQ